MLYIPKKWKFKKKQKGKKLNTISKIYTTETLLFNKLGLKAKETGHMTSKQIIALKQTINKIIKKKRKS
jgi:ribosomal protein L16/L10AE